MARQEANKAFQSSSFLYGGNAAYLEDLYARYQENPASLDAGWQGFFKELKDDRADVLRSELITHRLPLSRIDEAFEIAADSARGIKVLVLTDVIED